MAMLAAPAISNAFGILGPLEVSLGGAPVWIPAGRRRALVARLLVSVNEVVSADRLIEDVWGDAIPAQPHNALQACVSSLRSVLEATRAARAPRRLLLTREPGYLLRLSDDQLDALRFERLVGQGRAALRAGRLEQAAESLAGALEEWRGPALAEFADQPWAVATAARLEELRAAALEDSVEARLGLGLHSALVGELDAAVTTHPLRERLRGQLMLALYRCGRQAEALRAFGELRRILAEELGIEPSAKLRRLEEAVLLQGLELDWQPPEDERFVLRRASAPVPHNLPAALSSFVGRRAELAALRGVVGSTRLLTLTGPGGVGKTRLALELAVDVLDEHTEGVWVVELASTSDPSLVAAQVRAALGLVEESDASPLETLARHLRSGRALLVLDNCEHLIEVCAALARDLLRTCPGLRIVATSRERLRVEGETAWTVPSLSLPQPGARRAPEALADSDAARLVVERVSAARGGGMLSPADQEAVVEICQRLDGIPLALELAAARANVFALPEIAARLGDRFALLTATSRADPRHRTLRAAVDWTYDGLREPERRLFERVSVFTGGFTIDAAEQVCAGDGIERHDVLDLLAALTDKSVVSPAERAGKSRYALLETLRQYGAEKLRQRGDEDHLRDSHLDWAVLLAEAAEVEVCGRYVCRWLQTLDDEYDNLQAALVWAESRGRHSLGVRLASGIQRYWDMRGRVAEGRAWIERLLAGAPELDPLLRARSLAAASALAFIQGDSPTAERFAVESLALAECAASDRDIARACVPLGNALLGRAFSGRDPGEQPPLERLVEVAPVSLSEETIAVPARTLREARTAYERALGSARRADDQFMMAMALVNLGFVATCGGDLASARSLLEDSLAIRRKLGNAAFVARSLAFLGFVAFREGRLEEAQRLLEESVGTLREVGDARGLAEALIRYGIVLRTAEEFELACNAYRESASVFARYAPITSTQAGGVAGLIACLARAGEAAALAGDRGTGGYLVGVGQRLFALAEREPGRLCDRDRVRLEKLLGALLRELDNEEFHGTFEEATRLSVEEALRCV